MISGVRASSIRIESTSSTIANQWPRCTVHSADAGHVVAQVVEAELGVGAVGDVGLVGGAALVVGHHVLDHADRDAERLVDRPHPVGVAAGQVVVDRDQVHVHAGEGVQVERQRGHQRLALAGLHLGDAALVQHHAADQLDVEVAQADASRLEASRTHGEGLGQQVVEVLALARSARGTRSSWRPAGRRTAPRYSGSSALISTHALLEPFQRPALAGAQDLVEHAHRTRMVPTDLGAPWDPAAPAPPSLASRVGSISP